MSDLEVVRVQEPRVQLNNRRKWCALTGGQTVTQYQVPATSFSTSQISWTIVPPSKSSILDRKILMAWNVHLELTGTTSYLQPPDVPLATNLLFDGNWSFRAHPIQRMISSLAVAINGNTVSMEPYIVIDAMERVHDPIQFELGYNSVGPNFTDKYANYSDGAVSNNDPLGAYYDSAPSDPRGAYNVTVSDNSPTGAKIDATIYEYIMLPPLISGSDADGNIREHGGLTHLDTFTISATLINQQARILSISDPTFTLGFGTTLTNAVLSFNTSPMILATWITPRLTEPIPPSITYPYFQINRYTQSAGNLSRLGGGSDTGTFSSQVISLNSIPLKMYIYCKRSQGFTLGTPSTASGLTDTFCAINSVSLSFNNISGLLSGASQMQLYQMSVDNGLNMSWNQFSGITQRVAAINDEDSTRYGTVGSVLVIDPSRDLGLKDGESPGSLGQYLLQVTSMNVTNIDRVTDVSVVHVPFEITIVCVFDGLLSVSNNSGTTIIGNASRADVLNAPVSDMDYNEITSVYGGGSFFSKLGDVAKGVNDFLRGSQVISKGLQAVDHPVAKTIGRVAHSLGYGDAGLEAGVVCGGREMSHERMRRRLGLM